MNNLYKSIWVLLMATMLVSCNDEWTDELYTELISLKAPLNAQGVSPIYLRYEDNGVREYNLPVIVSGSTANGRDISVKIGVDNDTLAIMNNERFQYRNDLYYKQLPAGFYEFPSQNCLIPAGANTAGHIIKFNFKDLDLVEKWVLPLTILDDPSYQPNNRKGWRKALLHVIPFNNYSGSYSSTAMNVNFLNDNKNMVMSTRSTWVVDENSVFFYAGMTEEEAEDRSSYKVIMRFEEGVEQEDGSIRGSLKLEAATTAINFVVKGQPTYHIRKAADLTLPYLVREYCTVTMEYEYNDITAIPNFPIRYVAKGSMTLERQRNTTIPDEDQAIQW
jgi:hypothetical protein